MKRIVITGAESSGKTTLARFLAREFSWPCALEYARLYLEKNGAHYDYDIVHEIARGHLLYQAEQVPEGAACGIYDTDLLNFTIWCDVAYGGCEPWLREAAAAEHHHVYLICQPDLPWEPDPLREYPEGLQELYEMHLAAVKATGRDYRIICGHGSEREEMAKRAVQSLLLDAKG